MTNNPPTPTPEEPPYEEQGWKGLSMLFFWYRWRWVHAALRHDTVTDPERPDQIICACGMSWDK